MNAIPAAGSRQLRRGPRSDGRYRSARARQFGI